VTTTDGTHHHATVVSEEDRRRYGRRTYLSAVLLLGLVLNATLGWSWAEPIAGLVIAAVAIREGRAAWRGEGCCAPAAHAPTPAPQMIQIEGIERRQP
jgi:hypothetical protein